MKSRVCRHCGSPAKGNPCYALIDKPHLYRRVQTPCEYDAALEKVDACERRDMWAAFVWFLVCLAGAAWLYAMAKGWV